MYVLDIIKTGDQINRYLTLGALITFLLLLLFFIVLTIILEHHWKEYGVISEKMNRIRLWYFGVPLVLFFTMLIVLISLTTT